MTSRRVLVAVCAAGAVATAGTATTVAAVAASSSSSHTLKLVAHEKSHKRLSRTTEIASETDTQGGAVVGYDTLYEHFTQSSGSITGSFVTPGGFIYFHIPVSSNTKTFHGTLTGGTGKYANVHGTITAHTVSKAKTVVTITYH